jgi:TPR repeat protein
MSYDTGTGVRRDAAEAARWFRRAADQGDPAAQQNLGIMYANGDGVPQDPAAAYLWLTLAAAQAPEPARASLLQGRAIVAQQLTPGQLAAAERRAADWSPVTAATPREHP